MANDSAAPKSGGFLRGALGLFVELEDKGLQAAPTSQTPVKLTTAPPAPGTPPAQHPEMYATLTGVIMNRKTAYTALLQSAARLESVIPDESTRFKAAFVTVSGDGQRSLETINQAIEVHLRDIEGERIRFKGASEQQLQSKVASALNRVDTLRGTADAAQKRALALAEEIKNLEREAQGQIDEANRLSAEANQTDAEVRGVVAAFEATAETVKQDLTNRKAALAALLV